ncbi:MAG: spermidine synthase [Planctomycetota bacterium]
MPLFEILATEPTSLGLLCLRRREVLTEPGTIVTEITLDHEFLMSSLHTESERALASRAISMHGGDPLRVLVGGLGLGYTAHAALAFPQVSEVTVVEFLAPVIQWLGEGLVPLSAELNDEPRFSVCQGDVYDRLLGPAAETFDLILIDVDHSPDETLDHGPGRFYTREGLEAAQQHLAPGGVLGVWSYAENSEFSNALRTTFSEVQVETIAFDNRFTEETSTDVLFLAR